MGEGTVFKGVCLSKAGGGTLDHWSLVSGPRFFSGEWRPWSLVPGPFWGKGEPLFWSWLGGGGEEGGVPQSGLGTGVPPSPSQDQDRSTSSPLPLAGHTMDRIQRGRYESCVFAQEDFLVFGLKNGCVCTALWFDTGICSSVYKLILTRKRSYCLQWCKDTKFVYSVKPYSVHLQDWQDFVMHYRIFGFRGEIWR